MQIQKCKPVQPWPQLIVKFFALIKYQLISVIWYKIMEKIMHKNISFFKK